MRRQTAFVIVLLFALSDTARAQQPAAETGKEWLARCGAALKSGEPKGIEQTIGGAVCLAWVQRDRGGFGLAAGDPATRSKEECVMDDHWEKRMTPADCGPL
jgi:hypothetical protein